MIAQIVHPYNLQKALQQIVKNGGSAGVDKISTGKLTEKFREQKLSLLKELKKGMYKSKPILGVEIPKPNGKTRLLGIPTTTERLLQQAVSQVIMPLFEKDFHNNSYGFRPTKMHEMQLEKRGKISTMDISILLMWI